jgi:hypothetical protein
MTTPLKIEQKRCVVKCKDDINYFKYIILSDGKTNWRDATGLRLLIENGFAVA